MLQQGQPPPPCSEETCRRLKIIDWISVIDFVPRREFVISHPFNHFNKSSARLRTHKTLIAGVAGNQKPSDRFTGVRDYLKVLNWKLTLTLASSANLFPLQLPFSLELATRRKGVEKARNPGKFLDNSNCELGNWFSSSSSPSSSVWTLEESLAGGDSAELAAGAQLSSRNSWVSLRAQCSGQTPESGAQCSVLSLLTPSWSLASLTRGH